MLRREITLWNTKEGRVWHVIPTRLLGLLEPAQTGVQVWNMSEVAASSDGGERRGQKESRGLERKRDFCSPFHSRAMCHQESLRHVLSPSRV